MVGDRIALRTEGMAARWLAEIAASSVFDVIAESSLTSVRFSAGESKGEKNAHLDHHLSIYVWR